MIDRRPRTISTAPTATPTTARAATTIQTIGVSSSSSAAAAGDDDADSASETDATDVVVAGAPVVVVVGAAATVWLKASVLSGEIDVTRKFHVPGPGRAIGADEQSAGRSRLERGGGEVGPGTVVPATVTVASATGSASLA